MINHRMEWGTLFSEKHTFLSAIFETYKNVAFTTNLTYSNLVYGGYNWVRNRFYN